MFLSLLKRELLLGTRQKFQTALLLVFTLLCILLFPMAISPERQLLRQIAPGLIWVVILFASHLATPLVWQQDIRDGTLDELIILKQPLEWLVLSKLTSVWIFFFSGAILLTPALSMALAMDGDALWILWLTVLISSLPLSALTMTGGLMTADNNRSAILSSVILLPAYLPLLIFSGSAADAALSQQSAFLPLMMLLGISLALCPFLLYINVALLKIRSE